MNVLVCFKKLYSSGISSILFKFINCAFGIKADFLLSVVANHIPEFIHPLLVYFIGPNRRVGLVLALRLEGTS